MTDERTVLVVGATGKVGRHVVAGLLDRGAHVRAMVRDPATAALPPEVDVVRGDLTDPASVARAADGTDAAFLLWPSFDATGATAVTDALAPHVVYLSSGPVDGPTPGVWADVEAAVAAVAAVAASERTWTFLLPGGFAGNTLEWGAAVRGGQTEIAVPFPAAGRSLIHERDIAEVAVLALLDPAHAGRVHALTGPATPTRSAQVDAIGDVLDRELHAVEEPPADARRRMLDAGSDPAFVESSLAYWESLVEAPEGVVDTVEQLTGHPARSYREWVVDHVADFRPVP